MYWSGAAPSSMAHATLDPLMPDFMPSILRQCSSYSITLPGVSLRKECVATTFIFWYTPERRAAIHPFTTVSGSLVAIDMNDPDTTQPYMRQPYQSSAIQFDHAAMLIARPLYWSTSPLEHAHHLETLLRWCLRLPGARLGISVSDVATLVSVFTQVNGSTTARYGRNTSTN